MANLMRTIDQPVLSLREAMERLVEQSFTPFWRTHLSESGYQTVPSNFWEDGENYHLHLLAPGCDPASVEITATNGALTISGQMSAPTPEGSKSIWQEWSTTSFRRQVRLPAGFEAERCKASYNDGVLSLTIPKPDQVKPKSIKVQVGK